MNYYFRMFDDRQELEAALLNLNCKTKNGVLSLRSLWAAGPTKHACIAFCISLIHDLVKCASIEMFNFLLTY